MKQFWLNLAGGLLLLHLSGCSLLADESFDQSFTEPLATVWFKDKINILTAYYADTTAERALGLGNVAVLGETEAMLFSYQANPMQQSFWMKEVEYPIDIIWVRSGKISGITASVQPELSTTALADYKLYPAPGVVDWVVEVPAGYAKNHNVQTGDSFYYSLPE